MYNVVFVGPPGGGKGTEIQLLQQQKYHRISTGDLLRNEIATGTKLGKSIKHDMETGKLIKDSLVTNLLTKEIRKYKSGIIFDGYPRNASQAKTLDAILKKNKLKLDAVINIDTPNSLIIKRTINRYVCKTCGATYNKIGVQPKKKGICDVCKGTSFYVRPDDRPEIVKHRLVEYHNTVNDLLAYYDKQKLLYTVSGASGDQQVTHKQVMQVLKIISETQKLADMIA